MRKSLLFAFLTAVFICGFASGGTLLFSTAKASTDVTGIIQASTELEPIPKPSVPEFTVELVDSSYDVPTTYSIDPYTGENVTHTGYHVESTSIEVKIKNQPFVSYYDTSSGWNINFYYNIRIKGHYSEDWTELYRASDGYPHQDSESEYTVRTYTLGENTDTILGTKMIEFPPGAQVDFQVEAMIGYVHRDATSFMAPWVFTGEKSGWSETQTLTIPTSTPSPTSSPSPTPTPKAIQTLQFEAILGAAIAVAVIGTGLGLLIYLIKRK